jgi:hypothetical protein
MKHTPIVPIIAALLFSSCTREEPKVPRQNQEMISQNEEPKSGAVLVREAHQMLQEAKEKLEKEGKYDCCMGDACNHCALNESSCTCAPDLKKGGNVCTECYAGWQQGKGDVPNIKKENVHTSFDAQ